MSPVLSILLITHNQLELLKRCLESILRQMLNVPFEIIISDDRSSDGTEEWILANKAELLKNTDNLTDIIYTRCNSDDCHPTTISERCGWNKLNAWKHAQGKYMVNIDADDYLRSNDIYQKQIDILEEHPECSMCMQLVCQLENGESEGNCLVWPKHKVLKDGAIISKEEFFRYDLRGMNQTYMIRRQPQDDMDKLYGKWYDDTIITYHHLQYGPVVFLDRADYVWVQYPKSISHDMTKDDQNVVYGLLPLHHAELIPSMKYEFL